MSFSRIGCSLRRSSRVKNLLHGDSRLGTLLSGVPRTNIYSEGVNRGLGFSKGYVTSAIAGNNGFVSNLSDFKSVAAHRRFLCLFSSESTEMKNCKNFDPKEKKEVPEGEEKQNESKGTNERMTVKLTQGSVAIMNSDNFSHDDVFRPVLQVIDVSHLFSRWIVLSDGWNYIHGLIVMDLDEMDFCTRLQEGTIVKLTSFFVKKYFMPSNYKTLSIIDLDVIEDKCELIGNRFSPPIYERCSQFANAADCNNVDKEARMNVNLTQGAIVRICGDNLSYVEEFKPMLQVLEFHNQIIFLSDGSHYMRGFLSMECENSVRPRRLKKGAIVKINHFIVREGLPNHKIMRVDDLDILEECVIVGDPKPVLLPINAPSPQNMAGLSIS